MLADLVARLEGTPRPPVAALHRHYRFGDDDQGARRGGAGRRRRRGRRRCCGPRRRARRARSTTRSGAPRLRRAAAAPALGCGQAAEPGDAAAALAALERHRLLCAHREGPHGVRHWNRQVERWLAEETGDADPVRRGTPAARCWSPRTTTASASTTATPASSYAAPTGCCARRSRVGRAARLRARPARRGRDHARDDDPQEPGQPGRRGDRAAARRRSRGCSPASCSTRR